MEEVVYSSLKNWLQYRDKKGDLQVIGDKLVRDLVHAVNDDNKKYPGETSFDRKANVIKDLSTKYDRIVFVDDDDKNINAVKQMGLKNVFTKLAHKMEKK
jgi:hypothetical protein